MLIKIIANHESAMKSNAIDMQEQSLLDALIEWKCLANLLYVTLIQSLRLHADNIPS